MDLQCLNGICYAIELKFFFRLIQYYILFAVTFLANMTLWKADNLFALVILNNWLNCKTNRMTHLMLWVFSENFPRSIQPKAR